MATIAFISLGCDKNLVDSEVMVGLCRNAGFSITSEEAQADIIVINTCCFIRDALEESIETIIEAAKHKESGACKGIIVAGCLGQRYEKEIFEEMPEVDAVVGTTAYEEIANAAKRVLEGESGIRLLSSIDKAAEDEKSEARVPSTYGYYAYLKIAEGCDNHCTYCVIPSLRGKYRSRTLDSLVREAKALARAGVKELILVAQDTALYGTDLYGEKALPRLLQALSSIDGILWIRILYCYPEHITQELIQEMARNPKVCHAIDMPLQHGVDTVLKKMGRKSTQALIRQTMQNLRAAMPDIAVRTSLIAGFPQETDEDVEALAAFLQEMQFDRLGVFTYSQEDGTPAARMDFQIEDTLKEERKAYLMEVQKNISASKCEQMIGKTLPVIIDGKLPEENIYCGRSYQDAPDIDGMVFVKTDRYLLSGDMVDVVITQASDYDLIGDVVDGDESAK